MPSGYSIAQHVPLTERMLNAMAITYVCDICGKPALSDYSVYAGGQKRVLAFDLQDVHVTVLIEARMPINQVMERNEQADLCREHLIEAIRANTPEPVEAVDTTPVEEDTKTKPPRRPSPDTDSGTKRKTS